MKKINHLLLTLFFTSLTLPAFSSEQEKLTQLKDIALSSPLPLAIATSISTEVGSRSSVSKNGEKAVIWAEKKLNELGFDKVYKEEVKVRIWQRGKAQGQITSPFEHEVPVLALTGSVPTPKAGITAELIHFNNLSDLIAASEEKVKNKIVFISSKVNADKTGESYAKTIKNRLRGTIEASKKQAKALIIRSLASNNSKQIHGGSTRYNKNVNKIPAAAISNADADLLISMLKQDKIIKFKLQLDTKEDGWKTSHNVIAEITGSEKPEEFIFLAANLHSSDLSPGALESSAGISIITAAATLVKNHYKPKRSIRIGLFTSTEFANKGAKSYINSHSDEFKNAIVAIESNLGAGKIWRFDTQFSNSALSFADKVFSKVSTLGLTRGHNRALGGPNIAILPKLGVPVIGLIQDANQYFDFHHSSDDTLNKIIEADLQQNVAVYSLVVAMIANSDLQFRDPLIP